MRLYLSFLSVLLIVFACQSPQTVKPVRVQSAFFEDSVLSQDKLLSTWTGDFKGAPIDVTLRYLSGNRISGYNVHKGLRRNLTGTIRRDGKVLHLLLQEPGTESTDGVFELVWDTTTLQMKGQWKPSGKEGSIVDLSLRRTVAAEENIYTDYYDTLSNYISLQADGSCIYKFLPADSSVSDQLITVRGSFAIQKDSSVVVYWRKTAEWQQDTSIFHLFRIYMGEDVSDEYKMYGLRRKQQEFTQMFD